MVNSTAISVTLPSTPYLPPINSWTYVEYHEVLYHRSGIEEASKKLTVIGALPQTVIASKLKKYTPYVFYAHYFGKIDGEDQNIISRYSAIVKTNEDGMTFFKFLGIFLTQQKERACIRTVRSRAVYRMNFTIISLKKVQCSLYLSIY